MSKEIVKPGRRSDGSDWSSLGTNDIPNKAQVQSGIDINAITAAEIKTAYESNANTNAYTDGEKTKLASVETNATGDLIGSEIKTLYEAEVNTNAFTDAEKSKLTAIEAGATADQTGSEIKTLYEAEVNTNAFTDVEKSKLANIESGATADQTASEIKIAYESNVDTNVYTDTEKSKLAAIEAGATADQTGSEIKTLYEAQANTNAYTDSEQSKLAAIEAGADVTDATNVNAAGAVMNSDSSTSAMSFVIDEDSMASNLATKVPTQQSVKAYIDSAVSSAKAYQGGYNASTDTPSLDDGTPIAGIQAGDVYDVTVAGNFFTIVVEVGDTLTAKQDNPTLESHWVVTQTNLTAASIKTQYESNSNTNAYTDTEKSKLGGIESGATADQSAAEIKTAYESNANTNAYTDTEQSKLAAIEAGATADQSAAEIKTAYESNANTNAYTDTEKSKLAAIEALADVTDATNVNAAGAVMNSDSSTASMSFVIDEDSMASNLATKVPTQQSVKTYVDNVAIASIPYKGSYDAAADSPSLDDGTPIAGIKKGDIYDVSVAGTFFTQAVEVGDTISAKQNSPTIESHWIITQSNLTPVSIKTKYESNTDTNAYTDSEKSKLAAIESGATADQTAGEIKTLYESNANTNAYTDTEKSKLAAIESGATADQTAGEIKTLYESNTNTNAYTDTEKSKLAAIEAGADVTDATNVNAAGAVMNSDSSTASMSFVIDEDSMVSNLSTKVPTQQSVKSYVDSTVSSAKAYQGGYNAATDTPSLDDGTPIAGISAGDVYDVTVAGTFFTILVEVGDTLTAKQNSPTLVSHWVITQTNLTAASIKTQYESNTNTNAYTDTEKTKLAAIESGATADQSAAEIKTAYESNANTNAYTDTEKSKLGAIESGATADQTAGEIKTLYESNLDTNVFSDTEKSKLATIESGATADQTASEIKIAYESNANTNAYTDTEKSKLAAIESGATADQTAAEIKTLYESNANTNAYTDTEQSKLSGIEALADVTDATNVNAAGAVMNSDSSTASMSFVIDEDSMVSNLSTKVPTQQSVKAYVDSTVSSAKAYQGGYNASTDTPSLDDGTPIAGITSGDVYDVTVAGSFFTELVEVGDTLIAKQNSPTLLSHWTIVQSNLTPASIKTQYESNSNTNAYTDTEKSKLAAIESGATADQTAGEIKTLYESNADTNVFTDAQKNKVNAITSTGSGQIIITSERTNLSTAYTHSLSDHAPSNAQKNSDITKAEIEAKLIGEITSHTHPTGGTLPNVVIKCGNMGGTLIKIGNTLYYSGNSDTNNRTIGQDCSSIHAFIPIANFEQIGILDFDTSGHHSCVIDGSGNVWMAGRNAEGQCGTGAPSTTLFGWKKISGLPTANRCHCGAFNTYIWNDGVVGSLRAVGRNSYGELGAAAANKSTFITPASVGSVLTTNAVTDLATTHWSTMIRIGNNLYSTGRNDTGQLGVGDNTNRATFTAVTALPGAINPVKHIGSHRCYFILGQDAKMYFCGQNTNGFTGHSVIANFNVPTLINDSANVNVLDFSTGHYYDDVANRKHIIVLRTNNDVRYCGSNDLGVLINTTVGSVAVWSVVGTDTWFGNTISSLHGKGGAKYAIDTNGNVWTWGHNLQGACGLNYNNADIADLIREPVCNGFIREARLAAKV